MNPKRNEIHFDLPLSLQEEFAFVVRCVESLSGRTVESTRQVEGFFVSFLARSFGGGV